MLPVLRTARLALRPCRADDVDALHALWIVPQVRKYLWDDVAIEREQARQVVEACIAAAGQSGCGLWLIHTLAEEKPPGFAALRAIEDTDEIELIYGLAPMAWGQGFATEASRAVLEYGFATVGLPRIWGRTDVPNVASRHVLERLGMQPAGNPVAARLPTVSFVLHAPASG